MPLLTQVKQWKSTRTDSWWPLNWVGRRMHQQGGIWWNSSGDSNGVLGFLLISTMIKCSSQLWEWNPRERYRPTEYLDKMGNDVVGQLAIILAIILRDTKYNLWKTCHWGFTKCYHGASENGDEHELLFLEVCQASPCRNWQDRSGCGTAAVESMEVGSPWEATCTSSRQAQGPSPNPTKASVLLSEDAKTSD